MTSRMISPMVRRAAYAPQTVPVMQERCEEGAEMEAMATKDMVNPVVVKNFKAALILYAQRPGFTVMTQDVLNH